MSPEKIQRLISARLTLHSLDLITPFPVNAGACQNHAGSHRRWLKQRDIALLALQFEDGTTGYGELAPLPGFSSESLGQAARQMQRVIKALCQGRWQRAGSAGNVAWSELDQCFPSVQVALQMAFRTRFSPFTGFIADDHPEFFPPVLSAALAKSFAMTRQQGGSVQEAAGNNAHTHQTLCRGAPEVDNNTANEIPLRIHSTIKVKVARQGNTMAKELALLDDISHCYPELSIRLDGNRAWTYQQARDFMQGCQHLPVEFIEEPCHKLADNIRLLDDGWPVALDESLQSLLVSAVQFEEMDRPWIACVIKPMLIGGDSQCLPWVDYCRRNDIRIIVSSSFESLLGISYLARLAWQWEPDEIHGLDTLTAFAPDNSYFAWSKQLLTSNGGGGTARKEDSLQMGKPLWRI